MELAIAMISPSRPFHRDAGKPARRQGDTREPAPAARRGRKDFCRHQRAGKGFRLQAERRDRGWPAEVRRLVPKGMAAGGQEVRRKACASLSPSARAPRRKISVEQRPECRPACLAASKY